MKCLFLHNKYILFCIHVPYPFHLCNNICFCADNVHFCSTLLNIHLLGYAMSPLACKHTIILILNINILYISVTRFYDLSYASHGRGYQNRGSFPNNVYETSFWKRNLLQLDILVSKYERKKRYEKFIAT